MKASRIALGLWLGWLAAPASAATAELARCVGARSIDRMIADCTVALEFGALDPQSRARALERRGFAFASKTDLDHALADENESIRLDPTIEQSFLTRALIYEAQKEQAKALADYDTLLRLNPNLGKAYFNRAMLFARGGDLGKAIEGLTQAIRVDPRDLLAYYNRGQARFRNGDKEGALADLDMAVRLDPRNRGLIAVRNKMRASEPPTPGTPAAPVQDSAAGEQPKPDVARGNTPPQVPSATASNDDPLPQDLNALQSKVNELFEANRLDAAMRAGTVYVARVAQRFGDRSPQHGMALGFLALIQQMSNHYREAAQNYELTLAILEQRLGPRSDKVRAAKLNLGQVYQDLSRFDDAERLFREVIAAAEAASAPAELAEAVNDLATDLMQKARYSEAEQLAKRAYDIWTKIGGAEGRKFTTALGNLATIYKKEGRLPEAEDLYHRVIAEDEKSGPQAERQLAQDLGNLETVYSESGRYAEAEQTGKRTLALFEKLFGPNDPNVAQCLTNNANTFSDQRKDHEAELALNRALLIQEKALGPDSEALSVTLNTLGNVMIREGRPAEAAPLLSRALAINEKTFGPDHPNVARSLNSLAIAVAAQGLEEDSTLLLKRCLAISEKLYGPNSPDLAPTLNNLAIRAKHAKRNEDAEAYFKRALLVSRTASTEPNRIIDALAGLGDLKLDGDKPAEAEGYYKEVLATTEKAFGSEFPGSAFVMSKIGLAANMQNDWRRALDVEHQAYGAAISSNEKLGYAKQTAGQSAENLARVATNLINADWLAAAKEPVRAAELQGEAFGAAQRTNLSTAASALADMAARFGSGTGQIAEIVREQQDLASQDQALDKAMTTALGSPDAKGRDVLVANLRSQAAAVSGRLAEVNSRIARDFPAYAEFTDPKPLAIADVQKLLAPDEVLVTWLVHYKMTIVWAITKEGSTWQSTEVDGKQLTDMVAKLRASLDLEKVTGAIVEGKPGRDLVFDLATAHALYQKLLLPVAAQLVGKKTIVEVPVGPLTSLPLQLLVTEAPRRSATSTSDPVYRDAAWLAKTYAVTVLPSVPALRALRVFTQPSQATKPLAGFADPVFSRSPNPGGTRGGKVAQRGVQGYAHYFRGGAIDLDILRQGLPALPETEGELRAVAHDLSAANADLRIGEDATVAAVKAMALDQYRVVYFATHGLVAGDVSGLTEPALALTIPAHPTEDDSGLLTASDVSQLRLDADWVVLSACNTAAGDKPGAEGLSGLTRAFFYAGARALLVSNWSVRSDAAVDLTTHTFAKMAATAGLGRSEALRRSMLELIASGDDHAYPAVWAPFVVVGEGGSGR